MHVSWDFSTEPEFQAQLDWVEQFCRDEVVSLDLLFPGAAKSRDPRMKALVDPLKQQRRTAVCGRSSSTRSSVGPASVSSTWRCSTRSSASTARRR
jgi:hypothetical protein